MRSVGFRVLGQLRTLVIKSIRTGYRSVCHDHPFLVGVILFLVFLYRSSPLLFSLLVSASPVLICTFALLGILLSYGNPPITQIEVDDKSSSEISSARAVRLENNTTEVRRDVSDRGIEAVSLLHDVDLAGERNQVETTVSHSLAPTWQSSREMGFKEQLMSGYKNQEIELGNEINWRELGYEAVASTNVTLENHHDVHEVQNPNSETNKSLVNGQMEKDNPEASWGQWTWTKVDRDHGGNDNASTANGGSDEEDDESFDSGSDGAESSSPDPSMADITPLLDELYPLLENDNPDLPRQPGESSDVATDRSHVTSETSINSDEESDHKEVEEDAVSGGGGDGDDDDDDEEEGQLNKEDEAKSAINWTEDDQKNLMDLGSSEMERNQRLESLIARRRARRDMRMMMERNLIDLDGMDLPTQIAPIITTRQNPFDSPNNSYEYMGLPPIPGSAPSVFSHRKNPFDLPYDSSEEKPDLTGDSFQQEFMELTQKDPLFRRHESFNIGSSTFDFHRHDRTGGRLSRFRPYFTPERIDSDGTGHSPYTRQSSELSESSLFRRQLSGSSSFQRQASGISESSFQRQSSNMSESKASSAGETEPTSLGGDDEEMKLSSSTVSQERGFVSEMEDVHHLTGLGYHASSAMNSASEEQSERIHRNSFERYTNEGFDLCQRRQIAEIKLGDSGTDAGEKSWFSASWDLASSEGRHDEIHPGLGQTEKKPGSSSSLSSLSETIEDVPEVDLGLVQEELSGPLNLGTVTEMGLNGLAMSAIIEEENSSSSSTSVSSSEEYNGSTEEKNINISPRSSSLAEEYNDNTEEKKTSLSRSSAASSLEENNDVAEENKSGHSRSSSSSSSEEYNDAAKVGVKVAKELVNEHSGASELDQKSGIHADEVQEVNVLPKASNFNETSENSSDWTHEVPTGGHTTENQDPVYDLSPHAYDKLSAISSEFNSAEETDEKELLVGNHHYVAETVEKAYDLQDDDPPLDSGDMTSSDAMKQNSKDVKEQVSGEATFILPELPKISREVDLIQELAPESFRQKHVSVSDEENYTVETEHSVVHTEDSVPEKEQPTNAGTLEEMSYVDKSNNNVHDVVNAPSLFSGDETEQNPIATIPDVSVPGEEKMKVIPLNPEDDKTDSLSGEEKLKVTPLNPEDDKTDSLSEFGESVIASENINSEEVDVITEMDEAILSELDAVGDFSLGAVDLVSDLDITSEDVISDKTEQGLPNSQGPTILVPATDKSEQGPHESGFEEETT